MSYEQQKVKMKSAMLTVVAALVFVALMLTGCATDCEVTTLGITCTYSGLSSACCDDLKGDDLLGALDCVNDDDATAIADGTCS